MTNTIEYTQQEANEAKEARIFGEWDHPQLLKIGPLLSIQEDIELINSIIKKGE